MHLAAIVAFCLALPSATYADTPVRHVTDYTITLAGLTIAKASFNTVLRGRDYSVSGHFRSAGIAELFTDISGDASAHGSIMTRGAVNASDYRLVYRKGERARIYDVRMRDGRVTDTTIMPVPHRDPESWVAVRDADLRRVVDPVSGLMLTQGEGLCSGNLPVFDGETRMDLALSERGTRSFAVGKRRMEVTVCGARYLPKAGFKRGRKDIEAMKAAQIEIWFAKSETVGLYAPVYALIPTKTGNVVIRATRFGK